MPAKKENAPGPSGEPETTFTCKFCQQAKPLSEMTVINRFFPAAISCRDCARKLR